MLSSEPPRNDGDFSFTCRYLSEFTKTQKGPYDGFVLKVYEPLVKEVLVTTTRF